MAPSRAFRITKRRRRTVFRWSILFGDVIGVLWRTRSSSSQPPSCESSNTDAKCAQRGTHGAGKGVNGYRGRRQKTERCPHRRTFYFYCNDPLHTSSKPSGAPNRNQPTNDSTYEQRPGAEDRTSD